MKKRFQPLWLLSAVAFVLSVGLALNAQQTTPQQGQSSDQQAQQPAAPPMAQTPTPPTSDEPAPPPQAQQSAPPNNTGQGQTATPPAAQTPEPPTSEQPAPPPGAQSPTAPSGATPPSSASPSTAPPPTGSAGQSTPNGVQAFSGTVVKVGDRYMLHDEASGQTYDLDHQEEVQKYAGKRVRVHGTLDPAGKMIRLQ